MMRRTISRESITARDWMYGEKYWKARPKSELKVESKGKLEDDVDALYMPIGRVYRRAVLAGRLKQTGRGNEAEFVKTLVKPSICVGVALLEASRSIRPTARDR